MATLMSTHDPELKRHDPGERLACFHAMLNKEVPGSVYD